MTIGPKSQVIRREVHKKGANGSFAFNGIWVSESRNREAAIPEREAINKKLPMPFGPIQIAAAEMNFTSPSPNPSRFVRLK